MLKCHHEKEVGKCQQTQAAAREQAARGLRDLLKKAVAESERRNPYSTRMFFGMHAEAERAISEFDKTWGQK